MKMYKLLLLAPIILLLSCSDDSFTDKLEGTWELVSIDNSDCSELNLSDSVESTNSVDCFNNQIALHLTFRENGNVTSFAPGFSESHVEHMYLEEGVDSGMFCNSDGENCSRITLEDGMLVLNISASESTCIMKVLFERT